MLPNSLTHSLARWCLARVLEAIGHPPLALQIGGGTLVSGNGAAPIGSVRIADWPTLFRLALEPEYQFGEGFSNGRITVDGDLVEMLTETYRSSAANGGRGGPHHLRSALLSWIQANTRRGSHRNIHRHYDLGTDFYRLWLGEQLVYTGAYFADPRMSLEAAQVSKMDHVCRKVGISPGDEVIEAGCGWGALALHIAREYGARVRAFNISHEQVAYARQRALTEGLADRVEFLEEDYRNISGTCDVFLSIGMIEHVGPRRYGDLAAVIDSSLRREGRALLHFIGRNHPMPLNAWIRRRIFPGAYAPTLREVLRVFEAHDYSVLDIENLRLHYALTLKHWLERYERAAGRVREMFGPVFERAWRLYLAGSAASFRAGALQLFQVSLARGASNRIPWTRAGVYVDAPGSEET